MIGQTSFRQDNLRQTSLSKSQHTHLKLTLRKLGPFYFNINDLWLYVNLKAKKGQVIESPDLIINYVMDKMISESFSEASGKGVADESSAVPAKQGVAGGSVSESFTPAWSLVGNEWIRYIAPKCCQNGRIVKDLRRD